MLLIFIKNPELGKVKTRLAASVGDEKALIIYEKLLQHTYTVVESLPIKKQFWYSDFIPQSNRWAGGEFEKKIQQGYGLGERMKFAFQQAFNDDYKKVVIIGSDCGQIQAGHIEQAFKALEKQDAVIGPASDGGYYLLGLARHVPQLFVNKPWGTSDILQKTLSDFEKYGMMYHTLDKLIDVDTEEDWKKVSDQFR